MNEQDLRNLIAEKGINSNTYLVITLIDSGKEVDYNGRIEFFTTGQPAIQNGRLGIRIQAIKGGDYMPYPGGLELTNLISIRL